MSKEINFQDLKEALVRAFACLEANKDHVNNLNVFPVPDGDTGTNMSLTMKSAVQEVKNCDKEDIYQIAKAASNGALMGARGNSGVILSQLLRGFSMGLKDKEKFDTFALKDAFVEAAAVAYKAVMKPTEGTVLTVARVMGEFASENIGKYQDVKEFLQDILKKGHEILKETPEMLPALKEAGVVDAGGRGLLYLIEGALNKSITVDVKGTNYAMPKKEQSATEDDNIEFGYCTEFMINVKNGDYLKFRESISGYGDSIIVVGGEDVIKCHIHTNHPGEVLEMAMKLGPLKDMKIDNMRLQHRHLITDEAAVKEAMKKEIDQKKKDYGFVSISIGEGLSNIFTELGVDQLISGGQTMNPSTEDILKAVNQINADTIFILPNNKNIILAAEQAKKISDKNISVIKTKSIPEGFAAMLAFDEDVSFSENHKAMVEAVEEVKTAQVTYSIRDSEMNGKKIKDGDIIGIVESDIKVVGEKIEEVAKDLVDSIVEEEDYLITIYYGEDVSKEDAEKLAKDLESKYEDFDIEVIDGGQPLYYYLISI